MSFKIVRTLRSPSSERYLIQSETGTDLASLDIHYLVDTRVVGTLIVVDDSVSTESEIEEMLRFVDETLLPMASLDESNLSFAVLKGNVVGQFENEK